MLTRVLRRHHGRKNCCCSNCIGARFRCHRRARIARSECTEWLESDRQRDSISGMYPEILQVIVGGLYGGGHNPLSFVEDWSIRLDVRFLFVAKGLQILKSKSRGELVAF